jgi:hypothetical protein
MRYYWVLILIWGMHDNIILHVIYPWVIYPAPNVEVEEGSLEGKLLIKIDTNEIIDTNDLYNLPSVLHT